MKCSTLFVSVLAMLSTSLSFANTLSAPSFNLGSAILQHATEHANTASFSLTVLSKYDVNYRPNLYWDVICDYNTRETGNAAPPNSSDPLAVQVSLNMVTGVIQGNNYTSKGFILPSGKLEIIVYTVQNNRSSIDFTNYDTTGDLIISNCIATLKIVPSQ